MYLICIYLLQKCIKRNLGLQKIKEIENTDDWKCFKCNNKCLWDLRAVCWALLRYCDMKNKCVNFFIFHILLLCGQRTKRFVSFQIYLFIKL